MRKTYKNRKVSVVAILLLVGIGGAIVLESCDQCKCTEPEKFYTVEKTDLSILRKTLNPEPVYELLPDSGSVKASELDIRLRLYFDYHSHVCPKPFSFIQTANACSCLDPGYMGSDDQIVAVHVVTLNKLNATFAAGDTINSIARVSGMEIPDFIATWNKSRDENYYLNREITLTQAPEAEAWHRLSITIVFKNYSRTAESKTFWIAP
jgi:hypothetical protein